LAAVARLATARRVEAAAPNAARAPRDRRPDRLEPGRGRFAQRRGKKGGRCTGKNPTDKGKPGSKQRVIADAQGIPLASRVSAANVHDSMMFEPMLDAIPPLKTGRRGRPRHRPDKAHADKGYDYRKCRAACRRRKIQHRIARKVIESKETLGRHRWVIERTLAWLARFRRLTIRYERLPAMHQAGLHIGCALICFMFLQRF
jgi:transposase